MSDSRISRRKSEHLRIVLEEDVVHRGSTMLEEIHLLHDALPELSLDDIDTSVEFFGKRLRAPLMITSMTGGAAATARMNQELAAAAASCGIAFSVGSQRVLFRHPEKVADFAVRDRIPDGVLLGNIGGVQLPQTTPVEVASLVERIDADGICVHLNPAQELCQPEGDRDFRGVLDGIARLCDHLGPERVLVKETGAGLSPHVLRRLSAIGVRYVDIAGSGGTSWTRVEMHRAAPGPVRETGALLADWGVPTAVGVVAARRVCGEQMGVVGSGGVTTGLDVARVIAAGADIAGFARSVLQAWHGGGLDGAVRHIDSLARALRSIMLLTGSPDLGRLQRAPRVYGAALLRWLESQDLVE